HEVQPFTLRGLVGRFRAARDERHLRPRTHRSSAAAPPAGAGAPAASRLTRFGIGEIDRGVLVDLLTIDVRREAVRPSAIPRLIAQVHVAPPRVAVYFAP